MQHVAQARASRSKQEQAGASRSKQEQARASKRQQFLERRMKAPQAEHEEEQKQHALKVGKKKKHASKQANKRCGGVWWSVVECVVCVVCDECVVCVWCGVVCCGVVVVFVLCLCRVCVVEEVSGGYLQKEGAQQDAVSKWVTCLEAGHQGKSGRKKYRAEAALNMSPPLPPGSTRDARVDRLSQSLMLAFASLAGRI